jgi:hypothetical protein
MLRNSLPHLCHPGRKTPHTQSDTEKSGRLKKSLYVVCTSTVFFAYANHEILRKHSKIHAAIVFARSLWELTMGQRFLPRMYRILNTWNFLPVHGQFIKSHLITRSFNIQTQIDVDDPLLVEYQTPNLNALPTRRGLRCQRVYKGCMWRSDCQSFLP